MNIRELNERANMLELCEALNIKTFRRGATYFVHCPIPGHNDVHPTNCFFKEGDSFMYCTVCQKGINAVHLIMYRENCDYLQAAKKLAEFEGVKWQDRKPEHNGYGVTQKECRAVGLNLEKRIVHPVHESTHPEGQKLPSGYEYDPQFTNVYVYGETEYAESMVEGQALADIVLASAQEKQSELQQRKAMMEACGLDTSSVNNRIYQVRRIQNRAYGFAHKRKVRN